MQALPKCKHCGMHVATKTVAHHFRTKLCEVGQKRKAARTQEWTAQTATSHQFYIDGVAVGRVNQFRHLGQQILVNDSNDGAIRYNISKARAKWHMIA